LYITSAGHMLQRL